MVQTLKVDDVSYDCTALAKTQREMGCSKWLLIRQFRGISWSLVEVFFWL